MAHFVMDPLESRRLLSATSHLHLSQLTPAQIIAADQAEVTYANANLQSDQTTTQNQATADAAAVSAIEAQIVNPSPQEAQLTTDQAAASTTISNDQTAISTAATNGLPTVTDDYKQIAADAGNATALATDQTTLASDQATLQTAVSAAVTQLQNDQVSTQQTIANDNAAIQSLLQSTPAYTAAVAKQTADQSAASALIQTDNAIIAADNARLQSDINTYSGGNTYTGGTDINGGMLSIGGVNLPASDADTTADQSEITAIQAQLTTAQDTQTTDAANDAAAVAVAHHATINGSKQQNKLLADEAAGATIAAVDQAAIAATAKANIKTVISDQAKIQLLQNEGRIPAEDKAQTLLATDEAALVRIVRKSVKTLQADQAATAAKVARDQVKVADLLASTPSYTGAIAKQQSDATTDANNVQTDQAILSAADNKLATDRQNVPLVVSTAGSVTVESVPAANIPPGTDISFSNSFLSSLLFVSHLGIAGTAEPPASGTTSTLTLG